MEAGYQVGTRTIVDVLSATSTLYSAKQQLSGARYDYLVNQLNLKQALGTLNEDDLRTLNAMLGKPVSTSANVSEDIPPAVSTPVAAKTTTKARP
jgi:outer membrane protein